ncbi:MAG: hypothetical protein RDU20_16975 [Desulfomonilaceae bacterium]|nr:hypothetical protein [Desulfomonilaceae bacterium]
MPQRRGKFGLFFHDAIDGSAGGYESLPMPSRISHGQGLNAIGGLFTRAGMWTAPRTVVDAPFSQVIAEWDRYKTRVQVQTFRSFAAFSK